MGWYNASWPYRVKITFDHTKVYANATYPVCVREDNLPGSFWDNVQSDGGDIVITSDDGETKIDRDLCVINTGDEIMNLRFSVALNTSTDVSVYMYYGYPDATETNSTDAYPSTLELYIPGEEVRSGAPASFVDRTENGNDMTCTSIPQNNPEQKVAYGPLFDGGSDYATATDDATLDITNNITCMVWAKSNDSSPDVDRRIFSKYKTGTDDRSWMMSSASADGTLFRVAISDDGTYDAGHRKSYESSVTAIQNGVWHHLAFTFTSGTLTLYIDGEPDATPTKVADDAISTIYSGAANVLLADIDGGGTKWWGYLDEAKIYSEALAANVIKTIYANENAPATFYSCDFEVTTNIQLNIAKINGVNVQVVA